MEELCPLIIGVLTGFPAGKCADIRPGLRHTSTVTGWRIGPTNVNEHLETPRARGYQIRVDPVAGIMGTVIGIRCIPVPVVSVVVRGSDMRSDRGSGSHWSA